MTTDAPADRPSAAPRQRRCPVCGAPIPAGSEASSRLGPFCSRICADVDLLRWLRGGYVIAGNGADDDEDGESGRPATPAGGAGGPRDDET